MQLALDKGTHDLIKPLGGGVERVSDGRYTVQALQCKLKTGLGEWLLNSSIGWLDIENDLVKNYDIYNLEVRAKEIILGTKYVKSIISMDVVLENRVLTISFKADTIFGVIDLTVPWES